MIHLIIVILFVTPSFPVFGYIIRDLLCGNGAKSAGCCGGNWHRCGGGCRWLLNHPFGGVL